MNCLLLGKFNLIAVFAILIAQQPQVFAEEITDICKSDSNQIAKLKEITSLDMLVKPVEQVNNQQSLFAARPQLNNLITRPLIWEMKVNKADLPINAAQIRYRVMSDNMFGNPFQNVEVRTESLDNAVRNCDEKTAVVKGQATLEFRDLQKIKPRRTQNQSSPYQANIVICVSGKSC